MANSRFKNQSKPRKPDTVYIFFREGGWYPVELLDDADAIKNAEINPGTLRVEDINGRIIWRMADA